MNIARKENGIPNATHAESLMFKNKPRKISTKTNPEIPFEVKSVIRSFNISLNS